MALGDLEQHIGDQERRAVVLGQDLHREFVPGLVEPVSDAEDNKVFGGVTVIVMIANHTCPDVTNCESEAFSTCILHETNKSRDGNLMYSHSGRVCVQNIPSETRLISSLHTDVFDS